MLSYVAFFFCLAGLALAATALVLDRRSPLNRAMAAAAGFYAWWCFCSIFVYAAAKPSTAMTFYVLSFIGAYLLSPALVWFYLVLARIGPRARVRIVAPLVAFTILGFEESLRTNFLYVAFTPGPFGNVGVPAASHLWASVVFYADGAMQLAAIAVLLRVYAKESSRRVRRLLAFVVGTLLGAILLIVAALRAQGTYSLPPLAVLACAPGLFVNFFLITRYRYLRGRDPSIEAELGSAIAQSVFFLDEHRTIISMNEAAKRAFASVRSQPIGRDLANLVDDSQSIEREWELACRRRPLHSGVPCQIGGLSVIVRLTPHFDRFRELTGAVAVCENLAHLDETAARYGISPREKEIIAMLRNGYRNQEIADLLFVTVGTVKNHIAHIFQKTGVSNRVELTTLFAEPASG